MVNRYGSINNSNNYNTNQHKYKDVYFGFNIEKHYNCADVKFLNNNNMDMDFGYGAGGNGNNANQPGADNGNEPVTNIDDGTIDNNPTGQEDIEDLGEPDGDEGNGQGYESEDDASGSNLEAGTTIEAEGQTYTVDENGNVLDANGNIYKEASQVQDWIDSFETVDNDNNVISINDLQDAIGVDILDDNDNPITFDNSVEGISSYINAVLETSQEEVQNAAINSLFERYPILNDVLNYYIANGNSMDGYGEMLDRSGIEVDENNELQQEAIIRTAWDEQGRKGDVESYIQYLKSSGTLLPSAREELIALQENDARQREYLAEQAEEQEQAELERLADYWGGVKDVIDSRQIAGYTIPENIIINRGGRQFAVTPDDFYAYLYRVDANGNSRYALDLAQETPEQRRDDEILRAYLKFTGGSYSNLVDMAVNQEKVNNLKLRAKERSANSIRINRPKANTSVKDLDFGF